MFKRIGLSAAALLAAIALMQTPASAENRNYGGASGHSTSTHYMAPVQSYTPVAQNPAHNRKVVERNVRRPDDRRQMKSSFQSHRDHDDWNARNLFRW
jgi:hypothetical protein